AVGLGTTVAAPKALPPSDLTKLKSLSGNNIPKALRVDLFGDSTALVFGYGGALRARELDISVGGDARLGCGIVQTDHVTGGRVLPYVKECDGWQARWRASMRNDPQARPAVMAGPGGALDQRTAVAIVRSCTPAW